MLEHGADVDTIGGWRKNTPLSYAAEKGDTELCKLLLEHGAEVNAEDKNGKMPLHLAKEEGHTETCKLLLQYGAKW